MEVLPLSTRPVVPNAGAFGFGPGASSIAGIAFCCDDYEACRSKIQQVAGALAHSRRSFGWSARSRLEVVRGVAKEETRCWYLCECSQPENCNVSSSGESLNDFYKAI